MIDANLAPQVVNRVEAEPDEEFDVRPLRPSHIQWRQQQQRLSRVRQLPAEPGVKVTDTHALLP